MSLFLCLFVSLSLSLCLSLSLSFYLSLGWYFVVAVVVCSPIRSVSLERLRKIFGEVGLKEVTIFRRTGLKVAHEGLSLVHLEESQFRSEMAFGRKQEIWEEQ